MGKNGNKNGKSFFQLIKILEIKKLQLNPYPFRTSLLPTK